MVFLIAMLLLAPGEGQAGREQRPVPSVTVVGAGEVAAKPDMAEIHVGVVTQAKTAINALKENNEAMAKLFKTLGTNGIAEKDIQTSSFSVTPLYKRDPKGEERGIIGYQVTNQVRVRVRDLSTLGKVLDNVVSDGANRVGGISFSLQNPTEVMDQARRKAMADARRRADLYTKAADVKLGRVLIIQEQASGFPQPLMFGAAARAESAAVPTAPGELEIRATITVTYAIE